MLIVFGPRHKTSPSVDQFQYISEVTYMLYEGPSVAFKVCRSHRSQLAFCFGDNSLVAADQTLPLSARSVDWETNYKGCRIILTVGQHTNGALYNLS